MSHLFDWPSGFLRTPEAARFLGLCSRTLEKHRSYGTGPKYMKIGGRVIYDLQDLKAWANLGIKTSTSDAGIATIFPAKPRYAGIPRPRLPTPAPLNGTDRQLIVNETQRSTTSEH